MRVLQSRFAKWVLLAVVAGFTISAAADPIIVGSPLAPGGGLALFDTQWVAKAFTLNNTYDISQVSVQMGGSSGPDGVFYLTSALNSSSVLYQEVFAFKTGQNDFNVGLTLVSGTYYIVLGATGDLTTGSWSSSNYSHIENGGTVGLTYAAWDPNGSIQQSLDSGWVAQGDYPVDFQVKGTQSTVPEPASMVMVLVGLAALWRRRD